VNQAERGQQQQQTKPSGISNWSALYLQGGKPETTT